MVRVIPAARGRIAQDALLGALYSLLEAALDQASQSSALDVMDDIAETCADCARLAAVIALVGRRSAVRPGS